jgi:small-conductance mechanosensitive channel
VARVRAEREAGALNDSQAYARSQLLVLVSGMLRLLLITLGVALVLLPFGEDPSEWLQRRLGFITSGFKVGEVLIRPTSILLTMGVLLIGIYAVRVLRSWVKDQLLPVTRLDESMRMSTANLLSYLAYFAVFMIALSSLGLGLERMAWIVSALSVGIGFGLQAVVQNFVSGVILVAERPIKVGDWVSLDGVEGNVRKINARATEIELFDRSTMIVPNSEFITKKVRNVTMASPLGVVTVKFNLPVDTDAAAVRDMMMASMEAQSEVLEKPAPSVTLDGFTATSLVFSASCFVNSPRSAARMRSEITFDILARLREAGLALSSTQQVTILQQPAPHSSASPGAAPAEDGPAPFGTSA